MSNEKTVELKLYEIPESHRENAPVWAIDIRERFGVLHYTDGKFHCKEVDGAAWCKAYPVAEHRVVSVRPNVCGWLDKNQFPPAGELIEVSVKGQPFREFEYRGHFSNFVWLYSPITGDIAESSLGMKIRPIRTEREKAIEAAMNAHPSNVVCSRDVEFVEALYDEGLLRLPEDKK